ncbi:MAG: DoxX family protein [Jatrophihabitantaceae bacterium]
MSSVEASDVALVVLRASLGIVFLAHGYNHIFGGGKITGTARWFDGLGMKPGILHAWFASLTELGAGALLIVGFLTPLACAGIVGTMLVALITNHLRNGFFIFRPGEGYEYVVTLTLTGIGLGGIGAGRISIDHAIGWFDPAGWIGLAIAAGAGVIGALGLLVMFWRPQQTASAAD